MTTIKTTPRKTKAGVKDRTTLTPIKKRLLKTSIEIATSGLDEPKTLEARVENLEHQVEGLKQALLFLIEILTPSSANSRQEPE